MGKQTKAISEYIEDNTIIDKDSIRKALCMPNSVPDSFISRKLEPIGVAVFSGDNLPSGWSANTHFKIGEHYPLYDGENGVYPISTTTGAGMKMTPVAWTVRYF